MSKSFRIIITILSFFFLTGFVPVLSLVGPGVTVITTGNVYKAAAQLIIDQGIKKKTGKSTLEYFRDEIKAQNREVDINEELRKLVERRILETRAKLDLSKFNQ